MLTAFGPIGRWKLAGLDATTASTADPNFTTRRAGRFMAVEGQARRRRVGSRLHGWILFLIGALYAVLVAR